MKGLFTTAAALCMCSSAAIADPTDYEPLTLADQAFVMAAVGTARVGIYCPDYVDVPGALLRHGDANGADTTRLAAAIIQAGRLGVGLDYDRSKLIPQVTRLRNDTLDTLDKEAKNDKARFCDRWTAFYVNLGLLQHKQ
jgi:hypothetical protein